MGDIHGNIDALEAMCARMESLSVDQIFCTGDVVGYGAAPGECVDFLRKRDILTVCGNHDAYTVFPELSHDGIREEALKVFDWNRQVLSEEQMEWLRDLPKTLDGETFEIRHDSCVPFPEWDYVIGERSAALHFLYQRHPLCFNGHSHVAVLGIHRPGSCLIFQRLRNTRLPRGMSVMVGVGAVGQPRDGDPRACGVVYDTETRNVTQLRVNYDIGRAQKRILDAGLPEMLAYRLAAGR